MSWRFGIEKVADAYRPVQVNPMTLVPVGSGCERPHASASRLDVHARGPSPAVVLIGRGADVGDELAGAAGVADEVPTAGVVAIAVMRAPVVVEESADVADVAGDAGDDVPGASVEVLADVELATAAVELFGAVVGATRAAGWSRQVDSSRPARASVPTTAATAPCREIVPPRPRRG